MTLSQEELLDELMAQLELVSLSIDKVVFKDTTDRELELVDVRAEFDDRGLRIVTVTLE